jgi:hypothetical protein
LHRTLREEMVRAAEVVRGVLVVSRPVVAVRKRPFFECCFPYVCPEPVLVK